MHTSSLEQTTITTRDGSCRSFVFTPAHSSGPWPAVIAYMDAYAIRPAMLEVARRIADFGYFVLLPDLFYRSGPYEPMNVGTIFGNAEAFGKLRQKYMVHATVNNVMSDTTALLAFLDSQQRVKRGPIGTTGYCMGGKFALATAANWPDRIGACASFHGGSLATDAPDSPHLLAPRIKARVLVAGATGDAHFPDEMKQRLEAALAEAGVDHQVETWPAKHGWTFTDVPVYDKACSERHYERLRELYADTL